MSYPFLFFLIYNKKITVSLKLFTDAVIYENNHLFYGISKLFNDLNTDD